MVLILTSYCKHMLAVECSNKTCIYVHLPIIKSVKKSIQQYQKICIHF